MHHASGCKQLWQTVSGVESGSGAYDKGTFDIHTYMSSHAQRMSNPGLFGVASRSCTEVEKKANDSISQASVNRLLYQLTSHIEFKVSKLIYSRVSETVQKSRNIFSRKDKILCELTYLGLASLVNFVFSKPNIQHCQSGKSQ